MKNAFYLIVGLAFIAGNFYLFLTRPAPVRYQPEITQEEPTLRTRNFIKVGDNNINVEIAQTEAEKEQGLSGRESLESGSGMLFIMDEPAIQGFWMRGMNFAIDIVWIDADWHVIGVNREVRPDSFPQIFYSPSPAKFVLELPSGNAHELGIDTGSALYFDDQN